MAPNSPPPRIPVFFAIGFGLSLLAAAVKAIAAWLAETYLYAVPWIGGFLRSIELVELSNLLAFAVLGAGVGAATLLLPRHWDHRGKMAFLVVVSPFVFCASYMMQQHFWIQRVATRGDIPYREARDLSNAFLKKESGSSGFFGFFPFSTQLADLPTRRRDLEAARPLAPGEALTKELASYNDPRADFAAFMFQRVGWVVRFMYMTIAALTALIYYFRGYSWAESKHLSSSNGKGSPPVQGLYKSGPGKSSPGKSSPGKSSPGKSSPGKSGPGKSSPGKSSPGKSSSGKGMLGKRPKGGKPPGKP